MQFKAEHTLEKGASGLRLDREEILSLVESVTPRGVHAIGRAALANRMHRFNRKATYVFNMHVNPSNICGTGCTFCDYAASRNAPHAYTLSEEEIIARIKKINPVEVHIVGGLNQIWPYDRNLALVAYLRQQFPELHIKAFTAVEIEYFAKTTGKKEEQILLELKDAGVNALPGGGAEIFSERLYRLHWKNKTSPKKWIAIHELAHSLGIPTNATMLFGFGDTWHERIDHLLILREAQDRSKGFSCFIPLAFQPGEGKISKVGPAPLEILMVIGLSRLILDNIDHLKSYWPMTGIEVASAGLSWGADDLDGTVYEEKIAHLAGSPTPVGLSFERMREMIHMAGFEPVERDGFFQVKENRASL
jgi:aminodeoxyfutalosine synthase